MDKPLFSSFATRSSFTSFLVLLLIIIPLIVIICFFSLDSTTFSIEKTSELVEVAEAEAEAPTPTQFINSSSQHNEASEAPTPSNSKETSEAPTPFSSTNSRETSPPTLVRINI